MRGIGQPMQACGVACDDAPETDNVAPQHCARRVARLRVLKLLPSYRQLLP